MITDTQIIEAVRAVLPLDLFAIFHFLARCADPIAAVLKRAMDAPVIGWIATVLWVAFMVFGFFATWGVALGIWVSSVLVLIAVTVVSPILAAVINDVLALPRALVGR